MTKALIKKNVDQCIKIKEKNFLRHTSGEILQLLQVDKMYSI